MANSSGDLFSLSRVNDNYKFLLTCIDVLSKYAWVVPVKDKYAKSLVDAVAYIFQIKYRVIKAKNSLIASSNNF